jgi:hypothetical protein
MVRRKKMKLPKIKVSQIAIAIAVLIASMWLGREASKLTASTKIINQIFHTVFFVISIVDVWACITLRKLKRRFDIK